MPVCSSTSGIAGSFMMALVFSKSAFSVTTVKSISAAILSAFIALQFVIGSAPVVAGVNFFFTCDIEQIRATADGSTPPGEWARTNLDDIEVLRLRNRSAAAAAELSITRGLQVTEAYKKTSGTTTNYCIRFDAAGNCSTPTGYCESLECVAAMNESSLAANGNGDGSTPEIQIKCQKLQGCDIDMVRDESTAEAAAAATDEAAASLKSDEAWHLKPLDGSVVKLLQTRAALIAGVIPNGQLVEAYGQVVRNYVDVSSSSDDMERVDIGHNVCILFQSTGSADKCQTVGQQPDCKPLTCVAIGFFPTPRQSSAVDSTSDPARNIGVTCDRIGSFTVSEVRHGGAGSVTSSTTSIMTSLYVCVCALSLVVGF